MSGTCVANVTAGSYVQLEASDSGNTGKFALFQLWAVQLKGVIGDTGPQGADGDITWEGAWASQNYTANEAVSYLGSSYVCHTNTTSNQAPTDTNYWDVLASKGGNSATIYKTTTTQTVTGITFTNITEMVTESLAAGTYHFWFTAAAQSSASASGMGFRVAAGTATLSACLSQFYIPVSTTGTDSLAQHVQTDGTTNIQSGSVSSANVNYPIIGFGYFTVSSPGTVAAQMRNESAAQGTQIQSGGMFQIVAI